MEETNCGYTCMAQNPLNLEQFVTSSQIIDEADQGIYLWEVNPDSWAADADVAKQTAPMKRARTNVSRISPLASLRCPNGVQSLSWASQSVLVAGCTDHQIRVFDMERQKVQASVFTNHKVATTLDCNFANESQLVLSGHEDGLVRLFDLRQAQVKQTKVFECHDRYISQVKINPQAENVFVTCALDGLLKLWDLRNEQAPLYVLKRQTGANDEDAKLFGLGWNGASQILSGGSDSHVSVHSM
uniref:Uncharacterized protein n=1 Tax=Favella ehrenbergii TaxID=182087 RepID=A0A7S3HZI4_9SPIT|mmetsp:Transcript_37572/g.49444  ORF Transcript_37572/g.49444 Transcript_37572/m.49444 type:complete len:243 (-) Transcript_37572:69-797(-)|eukprot:Macronucleus_2461.p1 GENE.Macronucleus_2461~~Macronucleus_2461.p1  ORF type:complete len:243 (+),score=57.11 Macronucleus_2461:1-729(+)